MRFMVFSHRNMKEILRDPVNLCFGAAFPVVLIVLLWAINSNIPTDIFNINKLAPGMCVFGLSFVSLFSGMLIARDRTTSFLMRMFASPMKPSDFILGYVMPLLPLSVLQSLLCLTCGLILGMEFNVGFFLTLVVLIPAALLFIGIGLWCGSVLTDRQVGGICGALLTNLCAWLSGIWFNLDLVGGIFAKIANLLPFCHAVNAANAANSGNYGEIFPDLIWVIVYALVILVLAVMEFSKRMKI